MYYVSGVRATSEQRGIVPAVGDVLVMCCCGYNRIRLGHTALGDRLQQPGLLSAAGVFNMGPATCQLPADVHTRGVSLGTVAEVTVKTLLVVPGMRCLSNHLID